MKLALTPAPWVSTAPGPELLEAVEILGDGVWRAAAIDFFARREARLRAGQQAPKGIQPFLNDVVDARFARAGWEGASGRFRKHTTWVRVTFRHSMSLGSDFIDALKVVRKEHVDQAAICAATFDFLRLISPNDAAALVSYERLWTQTSELRGVIDIPLFIGELSPRSTVPSDVAEAIGGARPRDLYRPVDPETY
jgi:hypothetical protein